jgi:hypothetical protein
VTEIWWAGLVGGFMWGVIVGVVGTLLAVAASRGKQE